MINTIIMPKIRKTSGAYQTSVKFNPRVDVDQIKKLDEVAKYLSKFGIASKHHVFKYLIDKGYEAWKKESKS